jgi:hypothetical protein
MPSDAEIGALKQRVRRPRGSLQRSRVGQKIFFLNAELKQPVGHESAGMLPRWRHRPDAQSPVVRVDVKHAYARSALGPLRADDRRNVCKRCYNMLATRLRKAFIKIPKSCTRLSSLIIENKAGALEPFTAN